MPPLSISRIRGERKGEGVASFVTQSALKDAAMVDIVELSKDLVSQVFFDRLTSIFDMRGFLTLVLKHDYANGAVWGELQMCCRLTSSICRTLLFS